MNAPVRWASGQPLPSSGPQAPGFPKASMPASCQHPGILTHRGLSEVLGSFPLLSLHFQFDRWKYTLKRAFSGRQTSFPLPPSQALLTAMLAAKIQRRVHSLNAQLSGSSMRPPPSHWGRHWHTCLASGVFSRLSRNIHRTHNYVIGSLCIYNIIYTHTFHLLYILCLFYIYAYIYHRTWPYSIVCSIQLYFSVQNSN